MKQQNKTLIKQTHDKLDQMWDSGKIKPFTSYGLKEAIFCFNDVVRDGDAKTIYEDVASWYAKQKWNVKENPTENGWIIDCYL